jgi:hypothetical protein
MEIAYFLSFCLKWGLILFLGLGSIYVGLFRFRNISTPCRIALRVILGIWAVFLYIPTIFSVMFVPVLIVSALIRGGELFSDRIVTVVAALAMGSIVVATWWGLLRTVQHLEKSSQP